MSETLPAIGAPYGGGFLAALMPAPEGKLYAVIVPPKAEGEKEGVKWKTSYTKTEGTTSCVDGLANSDAMNNAEHPAAQWCRSLKIGGFDDWQLPASAVLAAVWANLGPNHTPVAAFQKGAPEAFDESWYWSSTEFGSVYAWTQYFDVGGQGYAGKNLEGRCRAVRKMILI
jgi:Protein of unknown function (DUF1566)